MEFEAPGPDGALLTAAARATLATAGAAAVPALRLLGVERYRRVERYAARLAWKALGADLWTTGLHHARGGPFVVLPLHESLVDPLRLRYLARDELWGWPHVGRLLRSGGHLSIPLQTGAGATRAVLRQMCDVIARGESVAVFPQGSILGIEVAFNHGAFWLAQHLGVPVLPVVIAGTHRAWEYPYSARLRRGCPVSFHVLEPIPAADAWRRAGDVEGMMRVVALHDSHAAPRRFAPERDGYWDGYPYEIAPAFPDVAAQVARHRRATAERSAAGSAFKGPVGGTT